MIVRQCLGGCGRLVPGSRCRKCQREREYSQLQVKRAKRPRDSSEDKRRADTVRAWRAEHGDWCPGYGRPPHESSNLTADHVVSVAAGGDEHGELAVLCRSCNSSKRSTSA